MGMSLPVIAVVTRPTRLQDLKRRWVTTQALGFRMRRAAEHEVHRRVQLMQRQGNKVSEDMFAQFGEAADELADDDVLTDEDAIYQEQLKQILLDIDLGFPVRTIDRSQVPTFDFGRCLAVVVVGQDGLVANTAKYVDSLPIIGVNPDPGRYDGILLPFQPGQVRRAVEQAVDNKLRTRAVTLGEVNTNDGQRMLAFNDFFVGCNSHVSARYTLEDSGRSEQQSSSGVLVSTGAGSTGWFSSVLNMTEGITRFLGRPVEEQIRLKWEDRRLVWAVREPFQSRHSGTDLIAGFIEEGRELIIGSQITGNGVIFSDGIEGDYLEFNSGTIARFSVSRQSANLVMP